VELRLVNDFSALFDHRGWIPREFFTAPTADARMGCSADTQGSTCDLRADGDDNFIVDDADELIQQAKISNTLTLFGVA
jgi:hypothetical protein